MSSPSPAGPLALAGQWRPGLAERIAILLARQISGQAGAALIPRITVVDYRVVIYLIPLPYRVAFGLGLEDLIAERCDRAARLIADRAGVYLLVDLHSPAARRRK